MVSLCPLVSRLSLIARTSAAAARILKKKTLPTLLNRGVESNWVIETRLFSVKSHFDDDDCGGCAGNKENNASAHQGLNCVSLLCPLDIKISREDFDIIVEWSYNYKDSNAFLGGRHGKMIKVEVDSKILEVPSGILPSSIKESDKKDIYRLHMEDQLVYTPEKLAKDYNCASETVDEILMLRDALTNRRLKHTEMAEISSTSDGQEIPGLPFTRLMKDTWAKWSANNGNASDKDSEELMKKYKKLLPPDASDDEVLKLSLSRLV
ncbi:hypothetical protein Q3G72_023567 [Acer saccharum]|nr:hypothetical protein Q3G72_023567 [Acer saccharum]